MKAYTGIGSRSTPGPILAMMTNIGEALAERDWTLRSGCAPGADTAFENGAKWATGIDTNLLQLFLPWPGFEGRGGDGWRYITQSQPEAYEIAAQFHPVWERLSPGARSLHARNVHQILGPDVTVPQLSRFVICWTPNGSGRGGTGQALRVASHYHVPVFDLARDADYERVAALLG